MHGSTNSSEVRTEPTRRRRSLNKVRDAQRHLKPRAGSTAAAMLSDSRDAEMRHRNGDAAGAIEAAAARAQRAVDSSAIEASTRSAERTLAAREAHVEKTIAGLFSARRCEDVTFALFPFIK